MKTIKATQVTTPALFTSLSANSKMALSDLVTRLQRAPNNFQVGEKNSVQGYVVYPCYSVAALTDSHVTPMKLMKNFSEAATDSGFTNVSGGLFEFTAPEGTLIVRYAPMGGCFMVSRREN